MKIWRKKFRTNSCYRKYCREVHQHLVKCNKTYSNNWKKMHGRPMNRKIPINQEKIEKFKSLKGIINSDISLEEIREERLKRYEIDNKENDTKEAIQDALQGRNLIGPFNSVESLMHDLEA